MGKKFVLLFPIREQTQKQNKKYLFNIVCNVQFAFKIFKIHKKQILAEQTNK